MGATTRPGDSGPTLPDVTLGTHWGEWLLHWHTARLAAGHAVSTIHTHQHYVLRLAALHRRPDRVTTEHLLAFLAVEAWAPETRKSARSAVRSLYRWAHGSGRIPDDPAAGLPPIRVPQAIARPAPEHLVRRLVHDPRDRTAVMAMLAAYCGLRRAEIARVHSRDLVGDELLVHGKGGKVRAVPVVSPELLGALQAADGWLFPNGQGSHLTPGHVGRLLSQLMPEGWSTHTLRHRMASTSYAATHDLLAVGAVLGHSRPETTQRYIRMPNDALRAAVAAASQAS